MMSFPLAVVASQIGVRSETFIRRHMEDLLPGGTVVCAGSADQPNAGHWSVSCPTLVENRVSQNRVKRISLAVRRRIGVPNQDPAGLRVFLQRHNVQVIMGEFLDYAVSWMPMARDLGVRFYGHAHGYDVSIMLRSKEWEKKYQRFNDTDGVIAMSTACRSKLIGIGLDPAKVSVIPYGVDVPEKPVVRPPADTVRCIAVGRMIGKKAPILLLDAFRRASEEQPNLTLDYIGGGELLPAARQFVHAFGLEEKVTLHGPQPSDVVQKAMHSADIFMQHSIVDPDTGDEEGLPVAVLEAMAYGLPVVSTRHAGIPEAVQDNETGYLVAEGDTSSMAERLLILAGDPDLRARTGYAGWQRAKANFSWEKERDGLLHVLGLSNTANHPRSMH